MQIESQNTAAAASAAKSVNRLTLGLFIWSAVIAILFGQVALAAAVAGGASVLWLACRGRTSLSLAVERTVSAVGRAVAAMIGITLLTLVFFAVILPIGLLRRLVGHDPIAKRPDPSLATYWQESPKEDPLPRYFRMY